MKNVKATRVAIYFCSDDHLHIELYDADDNMLAEAAMDLVPGADVVMGLMDHLEELTAGLDSIGPVMGHA